MRLMIYDAHCQGPKWGLGLTHSWMLGAKIYQKRKLLDAVKGVSSWQQAFEFILTISTKQPLTEIQFWGHGKWGQAHLSDDILSEKSLLCHHELAPLIDKISLQLTPKSLWWFRTCETFGAQAGHQFSQHFSERLGCRVAGHTYIIGPWQSGLHSLSPGQLPHWSKEEGLEKGTSQQPKKALWSKPHAPNTLFCLQSKIPIGW